MPASRVAGNRVPSFPQPKLDAMTRVSCACTSAKIPAVDHDGLIHFSRTGYNILAISDRNLAKLRPTTISKSGRG